MFLKEKNMKFEKVFTVEIPDPVNAFYLLKKRKAACECGAPLAFGHRGGVLSVTCAKCGTSEVPFERVTTYEAELERAKAEYEKRTAEVLKAKFDHVFNYTAKEDVSKEKEAYIRAKQEYNELLSRFRKTTRFADLDPAKYDAARFKREAVTLPVTEGSKVRCKTLLELENQVWALKYKVLPGATSSRGSGALATSSRPISHVLPYTLRDLEIKK
jgi:uncharacterized Zn finger protein (UPF0148 family)